MARLDSIPMHMQPIACFTIGNSDNNLPRRNVGWDLHRIGWEGFFKTRVKAAREMGFRRFALTNPGGTTVGDMRARQFLEARESGLHWLIDGLADLLAEGRNRGEEWICYMGGIHIDHYLSNMNDRVRALAASGQHAPAQVQLNNEVGKAFQIPIEGCASIAMDALSEAPEWSLSLARKVRTSMLKRNGRAHMYVETWPPRDAVWAKENAWDIWVTSSHQTITNPDLAFGPPPHGWCMSQDILRGSETAMRRWVCHVNPAPATTCADSRSAASTAFKQRWMLAEWNNYPQWAREWNRWVMGRGFATTINSADLTRFNLTLESVL